MYYCISSNDIFTTDQHETPQKMQYANGYKVLCKITCISLIYVHLELKMDAHKKRTKIKWHMFVVNTPSWVLYTVMVMVICPGWTPTLVQCEL